MPTFKFKCEKCDLIWEELQESNTEKNKEKEHISECSSCKQLCVSLSFGGSGFQFAGKSFLNVLKGFPDHSNMTNIIAEKEGKQMEKEHDAYTEEQVRKESTETD